MNPEHTHFSSQTLNVIYCYEEELIKYIKRTTFWDITPCYVGPCHHTSGCGWKNGLQLWKAPANISNKQPRTNDKEWSYSCVCVCGGGGGVELTTLHCKNKFVTKNEIEPRTWTDYSDKRPKRWNMNIRFGLWNVRSLYRAGSLMTVSRQLSKYKLDSVVVQEDRWEGGDTELENTHFSTERD
jgi:hypothetical protein